MSYAAFEAATATAEGQASPDFAADCARSSHSRGSRGRFTENPKWLIVLALLGVVFWETEPKRRDVRPQDRRSTGCRYPASSQAVGLGFAGQRCREGAAVYIRQPDESR
jgi:hypothetical protein